MLETDEISMDSRDCDASDVEEDTFDGLMELSEIEPGETEVTDVPLETGASEEGAMEMIEDFPEEIESETFEETESAEADITDELIELPELTETEVIAELQPDETETTEELDNVPERVEDEMLEETELLEVDTSDGLFDLPTDIETEVPEEAESVESDVSDEFTDVPAGDGEEVQEETELVEDEETDENTCVPEEAVLEDLEETEVAAEVAADELADVPAAAGEEVHEEAEPVEDEAIDENTDASEEAASEGLGEMEPVAVDVQDELTDVPNDPKNDPTEEMESAVEDAPDELANMPDDPETAPTEEMESVEEDALEEHAEVSEDVGPDLRGESELALDSVLDGPAETPLNPESEAAEGMDLTTEEAPPDTSEEVEVETLDEPTYAEECTDNDEGDGGAAYTLTRKPQQHTLWENGLQSNEEVLDNYRENLRDHGVTDEALIEEYVSGERIKLMDDLRSTLEGDFEHPYVMPTDWEEVAASLQGGENNEEIAESTDIDADYSSVLEGLDQEAVQQGISEIDIDVDPERLDGSLENFDAATWERLSLEEQKESMQQLADCVVDTIGFDKPPRIEYYNSGKRGDYGGYDASSNTLHVNEYMLYDSEEAADTIAHELWHAHQHERALDPQTERDRQYQYNFENYISPELGQQAYEDQLVESEARAFAGRFKDRLAQLQGRKLS